jgi:hypothetical protein
MAYGRNGKKVDKNEDYAAKFQISENEGFQRR